MPYGDPDRSVMDGLQHPQGQLPYPAVPAHNRFSLLRLSLCLIPRFGTRSSRLIFLL